MVGSLTLTRLLQSQLPLYRISATDPATLVSVVTLLMGVAMAATYVPARRACARNPIVALRVE